MPPVFRTLSFVVLSFFVIGPPALGHEDASHESTSPRARGVAYGTVSLPEGMILPQADGPRPWTSKPVLNGPDRFQIAIVTDRTGGHRQGVWLDAMRKLNLMRPEFVMSVGDLIEGYTEDTAQLQREWAEFLGFVDELDMRFFFVPGNHDVLYPEMRRLWREKFGQDWYSFDYRDVHFVCLNSEDDRNQIGPEQFAWLKKDLEEHADARWTLVFLHKPLWTYSERAEAAGNPDKTGWQPIQELLADRPHTVFAGHVHHYVQYERNGGRNYYSFATTGGGSQLRGEAYGEFDHVVWLTMEADGPHLAVLKLDGILPPGVVTEESAERFGRFLRQARIEVAPILIDNDGGFGEGDIDIRLVNEFGEDLTATGVIDGLPLRGLTVDPAEIKLSVGPTGAADHSVHVRFGETIEFDRLARTTLTATVSTTGENPLRAERVVPVVIDRRHACPLVAEAPSIDGVVEPWPAADYQTPAQPMLLGEVSGWKGPSDASFRFHAAHDGERVYFAADVTDERIEPGDRLELLIDGRRVERRREDSRLGWDAARVSVAPSGESGADSSGNYAHWGGRRKEPIEGAESSVRRTETGYTIEVALPKDIVTNRQGEDWHSFQLAVVQHDVDEPDGQASRILWRGSPRVDASNEGYGYFVRSPSAN